MALALDLTTATPDVDPARNQRVTAFLASVGIRGGDVPAAQTLTVDDDNWVTIEVYDRDDAGQRAYADVDGKGLRAVRSTRRVRAPYGPNVFGL